MESPSFFQQHPVSFLSHRGSKTKSYAVAQKVSFVNVTVQQILAYVPAPGRLAALAPRNTANATLPCTMGC